VITLTVTEQEYRTILAALHMWQDARRGAMSHSLNDAQHISRLWSIATAHGQIMGLTPTEGNALIASLEAQKCSMRRE